MTRRAALKLLIALLALALCMACEQDNNDDDDATGDDDASGDDDGDDEQRTDCDDTRPPLVFLHGFIENGDAFAAQAQRFAVNGYCAERIYCFDWNTMSESGEVERLEQFVEQVRGRSGAERIELLGHSMGGWLAHEYLARPGNNAKVAHYVNLASFAYADLPGLAPTLNISSPDDYAVGQTEIPGATNVVLPGLDHLQIATSAESFVQIYQFLNHGRTPRTTQIEAQVPIALSGRVLSLGENLPRPGLELQVYEVSPGEGARLDEQPEAQFVCDAGGYWGEFIAAPGAYYEFVVLDPAGDWPPVHYYREPFARSSDKVYFRAFPDRLSLLGLAFSVLPYNDEYSLVAYLNAGRSLVSGRDTLLVNGLDLAATPVSDPQATTIAVLFFDINFNGRSDLEMAGGLLASFPFIRVFDMRVPADPPAPLRFEFNGRTLCARNWPSKSQGVTIAMFE